MYGRMRYQGVFLVIGALETRLDNPSVDRIYYVKRNIGYLVVPSGIASRNTGVITTSRLANEKCGTPSDLLRKLDDTKIRGRGNSPSDEIIPFTMIDSGGGP